MESNNQSDSSAINDNTIRNMYTYILANKLNL